MLDEEMDHIIREAAENHHPAYNDKAWEMMEKKLDKHLPQKKDKRRPIIFLWFFLLLGAGIIFTVVKLNTGKGSVTAKAKPAETQNATSPGGTVANAATNQADSSSQPSVLLTKGASNDDSTPGSGYSDFIVPDKQGNQKQGVQQPAVKMTDQLYFGNNKQVKSYKGKTRSRISNPDLFLDAVSTNNSDNPEKSKVAKTKSKQAVSIISPVAEATENDAAPQPAESVAIAGALSKSKIKPKENKEGETELAEKKELEANTEDKKTEEKKAKDEKTEKKKLAASADKKKNKNKFGSNFGFTASVGPDISFVKLSNAGRTTLTYGAGLSYDLSKRFTARAGFYVTKKVYAAAPDEYHFPNGSYPYLTGVDANCKVYEIPVSVSYNFGQRKKHSWFGNAGVSSFIMKSEDYTYNYKSPSGQTYSYYQELKNKNNHYFSVLTLSAGYNYQLTKRLSIQAEPYAKIPLGGVGQGKIKLNSAGVLFSITYKPFKKGK